MHATNLFCVKLAFWPWWKECWIWTPNEQMIICINCVAQTSPLSCLSFSFLICELGMKMYPWQDCLLGLLKWWNLARVAHLTPSFSSLLRSSWHHMDFATAAQLHRNAISIEQKAWAIFQIFLFSSGLRHLEKFYSVLIVWELNTI